MRANRDTPLPAPDPARPAGAPDLEPSVASIQPRDPDIARWTDRYFLKTKDIVGRYGDVTACYAVFMRRPVIYTPRLMLRWLEQVAAERQAPLRIEQNYDEGDWVGAGEPLLYLTGSFYHLVDLETLLLQKLGAACVTAYNAYTMCLDLPRVAFLAMDARHCVGIEMEEMMAYATAVGSAAAKRQGDVTGFIGNANDATAHYFGRETGLGTMPHAVIGYAGSTLRAAEMFAESYPNDPLTVLVDYFGREVSDSLAVCQRFADWAASGRVALRLDTHGGRFIEGLDPQESYAVLERHVPNAIRRYRSDSELRHLTGTGVSAAAIFYFREKLDEAGFPKVKIVASSGFSVDKCKVMADVGAPIDIIGTGSQLPENWRETYATADVIAYNDRPLVKVGREFLLKANRRRGAQGG